MKKMVTRNVNDRTLLSQGLISEQVKVNCQKYGTNVLTPPERDPWQKLFLEKFEEPLIRILIIAAIITLSVGIVKGEFAEGLGIIFAILLATILAFLNEYKASQEFELLNQVYDEVAVKILRDAALRLSKSA